jgi:3-hydroxyisobutyrate dehydrogenase-like beta-hydroxyacid dehydrogenase
MTVEKKEDTMTIGFVGLGLMGTPMAARILGAGHTLYVSNRTKEKAAPLIAGGAIWCDSPAQVSAKADILFSMLSTPDVLEHVALGKGGILAAAKPGTVHVDCSTVSPALTKKLYEEYKKKKCSFLHSPVLGSVPNATEGSLLLFAGGEKEAYNKAEPVLKVLGSNIWYFERVDQASNTKLLCNFFIAAMISGLAQGLVFAEKSGIDTKKFLDILGHSALNAPTYQTKGASMIDNDFTPRFFLEHMLKDINLVLESAQASHATMPTAEIARELYTKAKNSGFGKEDYSAVIKVLRSQT